MPQRDHKDPPTNMMPFCEWNDTSWTDAWWTDAWPNVAHQFALDESRLFFAFTGFWRSWTGESKGETGEHKYFVFLATEMNDDVRPIGANAIRESLTTPAELFSRLTGSVDQAIALWRLSSNDALRNVTTSVKTDRAPIEVCRMER